ncbi:hypothetical protein PMAYCL1PPCAC_18276, partial [Pristionchus mayeri]
PLMSTVSPLPSLLSNLSNCSSIQELSFESVDLLWVRLPFSFLYFVVWLCSLVGNSLVLYIVIFAQISLSVRSVFIGCLAVSDILMSLTSLPITAFTTFVREWIFPNFFCKLINVFQGGSVFVSSFTLTAIAIDRCILVRHPSTEIINYTRAINIVLLIWLLGYSLALPLGIFSEAVKYDGFCGEFCEENWPDYRAESGYSRLRRAYGFAVLILQFAFPVVISTICYAAISRVMNEQLARRRGHQLLPDAEHRLLKKKNRANRMMVYMVGGLVFTWLPLNLVNLYRDFFDITSFGAWWSMVFASSHVIAMMSGVVNPVIYSWFNPVFRIAVENLIRRCAWCRFEPRETTKSHH